MSLVEHSPVILSWWKLVSYRKGTDKNFILLLNLSGVFNDSGQPTSLEHSPRDFLPVEKSYQEPVFTTSNVLEAVQTIFNRENWQRN